MAMGEFWPALNLRRTMKSEIHPGPGDNLAAWLSDPRGQKFFGRQFRIKAAILVYLTTEQGSLAEIARAFGVTRQCVQRHAAAARKIYL